MWWRGHGSWNKISAIQDIEKTNNVKELQRLVVTVNYLSKIIENWAEKKNSTSSFVFDKDTECIWKNNSPQDRGIKNLKRKYIM